MMLITKKGPWLFISHIPTHVVQTEVLTELSRYGSFEWNLHGWLPSGLRLKPDVFYKDMTYSGT